MDALVAILTGWIVLHTGLAAAPPPHIEFVNAATMAERAFGPGTAATPLLRAIYSQPERTVYLRQEWDPANLRDRSELLHELVHHLQNTNNLEFGCPAEREQLAYKLQLNWLLEQGVRDPYELLEINPFFVVMLSVCRDVDGD
jgi:hypothetical protein